MDLRQIFKKAKGNGFFHHKKGLQHSDRRFGLGLFYITHYGDDRIDSFEQFSFDSSSGWSQLFLWGNLVIEEKIKDVFHRFGVRFEVLFGKFLKPLGRFSFEPDSDE